MKSAGLYLQDILTNLDLIPSFVAGMDKAAFMADIKAQYAVTQAIDFMGLAVKKLPDEYLARHPDIPWREMAKTRDVLIHDYYKVDLDILWDVITDKLPPLVGRFRELLEEAR